jgi:hypothetical protein
MECYVYRALWFLLRVVVKASMAFALLVTRLTALMVDRGRRAAPEYETRRVSAARGRRMDSVIPRNPYIMRDGDIIDPSLSRIQIRSRTDR